MTRTMPIIEARKKLSTLPEDFTREFNRIVVQVTQRGKPVLAILPWELYESITETLEIMSDEELMFELRQGIKDLEEGRTLSWDTARAELVL